MKPLDRMIPNLLFNGSLKHETLLGNVLVAYWTTTGNIEISTNANVQGSTITLKDGASMSQTVDILMTSKQTVSFFIVGGTGRLQLTFGSLSGKYFAPAYTNRVVALKASEGQSAILTLSASGGTVILGEIGVYPGHHQDPNFSHHPADKALPDDTYILWDGATAPPGYVFVDIDDYLLIQGIPDPHRGGGLLPGGSAEHAHADGTEWGTTDYSGLTDAETPDVENVVAAQLFVPRTFIKDESAHLMWYQHKHTGKFIHTGWPRTVPYRLCRKVGQ